MRVVMSGGGTAGHVHPALSVAASFVADGDEVTFVGTPGGLEARLVPEAGHVFVPLEASGFDRARPWTLITSTARVLLSAYRAWRLLGRVRPDVVMGFGGYVSIPVGLAAGWRGIPLVLHEQNSVPGLANRFLSRRAAVVAVTYGGSARFFPHAGATVVTGNPVRTSIIEARRSDGRRTFGLDEGATVLLAFGGSRGARHLNQALVTASAGLLADPALNVIHVAGRAEADAVRRSLAEAAPEGLSRWRVLDYLDDMPAALAAADLVVARAGATSIAEITARGVASVLVPYPYATDDHQTMNARALVEAGGAVVIPDAELDGSKFADTLVSLLSDPARRATMAAASRAIGHPDATARLVEAARSVAMSRPHDR